MLARNVVTLVRRGVLAFGVGLGVLAHLVLGGWVVLLAGCRFAHPSSSTPLPPAHGGHGRAIGRNLSWIPQAFSDRLDGMAKDKAESDTSSDDHVAGSRATGGVTNPDAPDQASTTGTSPNSEFVGRVAGTDESDIGESGAERRAEAAREGTD